MRTGKCARGQRSAGMSAPPTQPLALSRPPSLSLRCVHSGATQPLPFGLSFDDAAGGERQRVAVSGGERHRASGSERQRASGGERQRAAASGKERQRAAESGGERRAAERRRRAESGGEAADRGGRGAAEGAEGAEGARCACVCVGVCVCVRCQNISPHAGPDWTDSLKISIAI